MDKNILIKYATVLSMWFFFIISYTIQCNCYLHRTYTALGIISTLEINLGIISLQYDVHLSMTPFLVRLMNL